MAILWAVQEIGMSDPIEMLVETARQAAVADLARARGLLIDEGVEYLDRETGLAGRDIAAEGPPELIADMLVMLAKMGLVGFTVEVDSPKEAAEVWSAFEELAARRGLRSRPVWFVGPGGDEVDEGSESPEGQ